MFPQAPEGFTRLIITNMKLELIFYKLLSPSSYISFNFHFIPSFFSTCFWSSILYYREVSSGMQEASHRQPDEKVCWSRKKNHKEIRPETGWGVNLHGYQCPVVLRERCLVLSIPYFMQWWKWDMEYHSESWFDWDNND